MRIDTLRLISFGPFTDTTIDLQSGHEGLHLIFGPNEAGKSSALRALGDLLFGIPTRSPDAFVHAYGKLRLGATLRLTDGTTLEFVRRKANVKSLRAIDDKTPLEESALVPFLTGINRTTFESMHGLDHSRLLEGGQLISQGKGHLGELLFSTGTGLGSVHDVQAMISADLESLYKPSGRNPKLNQHLAEYAALRKELKQEQLVADSWTAHQETLTDLRLALANLDKSIERTQIEIARTKRIGASIPLLRQRQQLVAELEQYQELVAIQPPTLSAVTESLVKHQDALRKVEQGRAAIESLKKVPRNESESILILSERSLIEELHRQFGSHQKAMTDRSELETELRITQEQALSVFARLGREEQPNDLQSVQIPADKIALIRDLGGQYQVLVERQKTVQSSIKKFSTTTERIRNEVANFVLPPRLDVAKQMLRGLQSARRLDEQLSEFQEDAYELQSRFEQRQAMLKGLKDSDTPFHLRCTPQSETVDEFEARLRGLEQERDASLTRIHDAECNLRSTRSDLDRLESQFDIPTEADLDAARHKRALVIEQLRESLSSASDPTRQTDGNANEDRIESSNQQLDDLEQQLSDTDRLADRLRFEADRVAQKSQLSAELSRLQHTIGAEQTRVDSLGEELVKAQLEWTKEWASLVDEPKSPREMRGWLVDFQKLAQQSWDLNKKLEELERTQSDWEAARNRLSQLLGLLDAVPEEDSTSIGESLQRCEELVARFDSAMQEHGQLTAELASHERELAEQSTQLDEVKQDIATWHEAWSLEMKRIGLDVEASPSQADSVLEILSDLRQILHDQNKLKARIDAIEQDAGSFEAKVQSASQRLLDNFSFESLDVAVHELMSQLELAQRADQELSRLSKELADRKVELNQNEDNLSLLEASIETHMQQLRCQDVSELANIAQQGVDKTRIGERLSQLDEQLISNSGGASIDAFLVEVEAECDAADQMPSLIEKLQVELDTAQRQRDDTLRAIEQEKQTIRLMDGGGKAAELAGDIEIASAEIESMANEVVVLRLMSAILGESINRYRDRNQDPVVRRASEIFAELTLERFRGLQVDLDEQGEPTLYALRANEERVHVAGLSEGTRDQLYLSMRIAGIEQHSLQHEPIPFVLDDVLMNFDDDRSKAALRVLARLSDRTQVILFTHHEHLVEIARETVSENELFVNCLDSRPELDAPQERFSLRSN